MKARAEKALQVIETKFFADDRTYVAGDTFSAAGARLSPGSLPIALVLSASDHAMRLTLTRGCELSAEACRINNDVRTGTVLMPDAPPCHADIVGGQVLTVVRMLGFLTETNHPKTAAYLTRLTKRSTYLKVYGTEE